ncbi:SUMF1/EgtB/PvdO family nonheme iron enzyme [Accumulibacter sp.]|uniref:nSTAND1 domain-containing NTPase n=1 Tax=Accumulibacter sp. TaxID=2053492 RepID=UPI0025D9110C|nr:SUMF1/EgtB/PvdO family nonheme iron enzyme [Accumulibacter sp.]MCM8613249.1 SUMF1/EgtB/PvdO family nonheme iron enzyme [Accumulibacter sp.]MCM8636913.1 SUMF1/EgtB/PvdO family nonheme iron enzyme [Accumulibacter sp.]MCM8638901.1 SUMF1/EgtB/PvdO family nonheme iron enzyme [Accumulibacter sp.]
MNAKRAAPDGKAGRRHSVSGASAAEGVVNPYPGLAAFRPAGQRFFFGRERDTERVLARLADSRLVSIVGRSGVGKSSLVAAGVVARLAERPGGLAYLPCELQASPFRQLGELLLRSGPLPARTDLRAALLAHDLSAASEDRLSQAIATSLRQMPQPALLLLDQFEDLFTGTPLASARRFRVLVESLLGVDALHIVLTVRSEFTARLLEWLGEDLLRASLLVLDPVTDEAALLAIITGPAAALGVPVQADLLAVLLPAAIAARGALPLISLTLERLYEQRHPEKGLTLDAYQRMGGLASAVGSVAADIESLIAHDVELDAACSRLFAELATVIDQVPARRIFDVAALRADPPLARLVDLLRRQGFIVDSDERHIELAHETLLSHWPRLRQWCTRYRDSLALRRQAKQAARDWRRSGEPSAWQQAAGGSEGSAGRWHWEQQRPALLALHELAHRPTPPGDEDFGDAGIAAWRGLAAGMEKYLHGFLRPEPLILIDELAVDGTTHERREEIGLRLNQMGDPRRGVGLAADGLPDIAWVDIAAGEVEIEGLVQHRFVVDPLRVARYPVTWQQYGAFVMASDGYRDRRWWRRLVQRKQPGEARWAGNNYPAINVCWADAVAFCRWLSARWGLAGAQVVRLPTEWEWQWIAQGGASRRRYPWGDDWQPALANSHESGVGRTVAVGMYPLGAAAGVYDLAGNVWEWCLNEYHVPGNTQVGGNQPRALRGGSWLDFPGDLRCGRREAFPPDERDGDIGFRIVLAPPFEPA